MSEREQSFGDYDTNTIPPGMAIEFPAKGLDNLKKRGKPVQNLLSQATCAKDSFVNLI